MVAHTLIVDKAVYFFKGAGLRWAFFSFLYLKKQNFKNICRIEKFSKMSACHPPMGDRVPVAHPVGDMT